MNEIWKPLIFKDHQTGYTTSSFGRIRDGGGKLLKFLDSKGRYTFLLKIRDKRHEPNVHMLVARAFVDNPNNFNRWEFKA